MRNFGQAKGWIEGRKEAIPDLKTDTKDSLSEDMMRKFLFPEKFTELPEISEEDMKKIAARLPKKIKMDPINYRNKSKHEIIRKIASNRLSFKLEMNIVDSLKVLKIVPEKNPNFKEKGLKLYSEKKLSKENVENLNNGIEIEFTELEIQEFLEIFVEENTTKSKNE